MAKTVAEPVKQLVHDTSSQLRVHAGTYEQIAIIAAKKRVPRNVAMDLIVAEYWHRHGYDR